MIENVCVRTGVCECQGVFMRTRFACENECVDYVGMYSLTLLSQVSIHTLRTKCYKFVTKIAQ